METQMTIWIYYITASQVVLYACMQTATTESRLQQSIEQQLNREHLLRQSAGNLISDRYDYHVMKRKRRYLEFPEGSSFQLVYDLIVGVVDYTNYLILGVTVALAWELPSKPPSEILSDLSERLQDGSLGTSRNDTIQNIKYIPTSAAIKYNLQPLFKPPMHYQYYTPRTPTNGNYYKYRSNKQSASRWHQPPNQYNSWAKDHSKFYTSKRTHPFAEWTRLKKVPSTFHIKEVKYPWWNLHERLKTSFTKRPAIRQFDENMAKGRSHASHKRPSGTYATGNGSTGRSVHRIYPIFGKRSVPDPAIQRKNLTTNSPRYRRRGIESEHISKLDQIHIEHHRRTRHELYERIETYLNGRGSHGHHCVLRALCETGQKSNEHKPGSFVGELMRAIFTLPEPLDTSTTEGHSQLGYKQRRYDAANALRGDCASRYNRCTDSLWSSHFVL